MDDAENQHENSKPWLAEHQFKPGVSGNPGGRPKGSRSITAIIRRMLEDGIEGQDIAEAFAKSGIKHALKGDFRYWKEIVERVDGKVAEDTDELARRIAVNIRNRSPLAPAPAPGPVPACDGPAAVQDDPGGAADGQDHDEQAQAP